MFDEYKKHLEEHYKAIFASLDLSRGDDTAKVCTRMLGWHRAKNHTDGKTTLWSSLTLLSPCKKRESSRWSECELDRRVQRMKRILALEKCLSFDLTQSHLTVIFIVSDSQRTHRESYERSLLWCDGRKLVHFCHCHATDQHDHIRGWIFRD